MNPTSILTKISSGWHAMRCLANELVNGRRHREPTAPRHTKSLVKASPRSLAERYLMVEDQEKVQQTFERIRRRIFDAATFASKQRSSNGEPIFFITEYGRLQNKQAYFYIKANNREGFLFEQQPAGWSIARAEKIVHQDRFLRRDDHFDHVVLFFSKDGPTVPRVRSQRMRDDLLALAVYEQNIIDSLITSKQ